MFKVYKGSQQDTYSVYCYSFISECNFYSFTYSAKDITFDVLADLLQGRTTTPEDIDWIPTVVNLTNQPAVVGDDGILRAVPVIGIEYAVTGTVTQKVNERRAKEAV